MNDTDEILPYNITVKQGETWFMPMEYTTTDPVTEVVSPVDITNATFAGQIRVRQHRSAPLLADMSFEVTDGPNGKFTASLDESATSQLTSDGYYDISVRVDNSERIVQGIVLVNRAVSSW